MFPSQWGSVACFHCIINEILRLTLDSKHGYSHTKRPQRPLHSPNALPCGGSRQASQSCPWIPTGAGKWIHSNLTVFNTKIQVTHFHPNLFRLVCCILCYHVSMCITGSDTQVKYAKDLTHPQTELESGKCGGGCLLMIQIKEREV